MLQFGIVYFQHFIMYGRASINCREDWEKDWEEGIINKVIKYEACANKPGYLFSKHTIYCYIPSKAENVG